MPTVFLPKNQYLTKFFLSNVVLLFGTTVSLMFMFLPKLWKLFSQIERNMQNGGSAEGSDESSFDGLFNNSSRVGWIGGGGSNIGGTGSSICGYMPGGRKGSVGTLDEAKCDTLKESHMGYMGVKFQNRYLPFLASWCMRNVMLYPSDKYFTAYELVSPLVTSVRFFFCTNHYFSCH